MCLFSQMLSFTLQLHIIAEVHRWSSPAAIKKKEISHVKKKLLEKTDFVLFLCMRSSQKGMFPFLERAFKLSTLKELWKQSPATEEISKSLSADLHRLNWMQMCQIILPCKIKKGDFWWLPHGPFRGNYLNKQSHSISWFDVVTDTEMLVSSFREVLQSICL